MQSPKTTDAMPATAHGLLLFACVFTWPLLFVGGLVTTYRVGMAVPDWPTTFGVNMFLYDFLNSAWGVFIEHGHRLYGSAVGLCLLILAPLLQLSMKVPARFKTAVWIALAGVIVQGIMGGLRVTQISTGLAMIHGCFGQLFFAYLACLAAWSGKTWRKLGEQISDSEPAQPASTWLTRLAVGCVVLAYSQIVAGAWLRHFQSPDKLYLHEVLGVAVVVALTVLGAKIRREPFGRVGSVGRTRSLMVGLTHLQWALGLASWWLMRPFDGIPKPVSDLSAIIRTAHQANGALVLAFTAVTALWIVRSYASRPAAIVQEKPRELEVACQS